MNYTCSWHLTTKKSKVNFRHMHLILSNICNNWFFLLIKRKNMRHIMYNKWEVFNILYYSIKTSLIFLIVCFVCLFVKSFISIEWTAPPYIRQGCASLLPDSLSSHLCMHNTTRLNYAHPRSGFLFFCLLRFLWIDQQLMCKSS